MAAAHSLSNPATISPVITQSENKSKPSSTSSFLKPHSLQSPWLGIKLSLQSSKPRPHLPNHRPITATVSFSLPTAKPDRVASTEKVPKWSRRAIKSFVMAELEARKLKYPTTGTEAFLMGILIEGTSLAAKFLRANGITLFKVREETVKLLGKADMYYFSPEHPPLTEAAQRALDWAVDQKLKSGDDGEVTTTHLLLGVWSEVESPGHTIMTALGFNDDKAKELTSLSSEPES
ncbi:ATP-dependent Clp protease ATP-binding subunit CLPT2, chloroplastic [Herrania umbratica]|uniref:ATP-dependent Clp protease ATP-binding subunit CLPT2, chloroplastic n=1 Tax=Herrania umbratica TaxID=108875 RepID=A0A6J1B8K6_9ROSI|nr:ATP-dependent Clp protease ATP-binding subunit CLPT2, chloroplastic [Herrania umbratica]